MKRLFVSAALLGASVAPAFAGDGGSIDGTGRVLLHLLRSLFGV